MPDFTAHKHPVLTVRCPTCGMAPGLWCRRPDGHMASDLHAGRQAEADRLFIEQHGELTRAPAPVIEVRHAAVATRRLDPA